MERCPPYSSLKLIIRSLMKTFQLQLNTIFTVLCIYVFGNHLAQAKQISLAMSRSIPPYIIEQPQSGIQLDIIKQAFLIAGHQVKQVVFTSNLRAERLMEKLTVDAIVNAPITNKNFYLSEPVIFYLNTAITLKARALPLNHVAQLSQYKVMAFKNAINSLGEDYTKAISRSELYTEVANQHAQLERLYRGQVDVIIIDKRIFAYLNQTRMPAGQQLPEVSFHDILPISPRLLGFHNEQLRNQFNHGLKKLKNQQPQLFK